MLRLPPFDLRLPSSAAEAVAVLAGEGPDARLVAGGTDLWPNMKRRHQQAKVVVGLMSIGELAGISTRRSIRRPDGSAGSGDSSAGDSSAGDSSRELRLGATTPLAEIEHSSAVRLRYPALARAVASISSPALRNMGTIGGNICLDTRCAYYNQSEDWRRSISFCMKEAGTTCWVAPSSPRCWAHSASDAAPMLSALGARVMLLGPAGERVVPIEALYRDDGMAYLTKRPDELLTAALLPPESNADCCRSAFWKLRRRGSIDFAVLSVAVAAWPRGGPVERARIVLGAVGSSPMPAPAAAAALIGKPLDDTPIAAEAIAEAARLARRDATPMNNTDFQAQWRGQMVESYTAAALREAAGLDPGIRAPRHRPRATATSLLYDS